MDVFFLCAVQFVVCTLGVLTVCGIAVELCYRICFWLMGKRAGRVYWLLTSWLGAPIHEGGHIVMCLLFGHHIDAVRLIPTAKGNAMVEHSYNKRNPYARFGNLFIGFGPIFSCLGVIIAVLYLVFPLSFQTYRTALDGVLTDSVSVNVKELIPLFQTLVQSLLTETTRPLVIRLLAFAMLLSVSLHVRISAADVWSVLPGLPGFAILSLLGALTVCIIGGDVPSLAVTAFSKVGIWLIGLFCLIFVFAVLQIVLTLLIRLLCGLFHVTLGKRMDTEEAEIGKTDPVLLQDYRDRSWEDFKK